ncbi:MAG TPA: histidinol dehydrogenase [Fibrobacteres bacterium]|nr:histidinol dehydrogenase [Fibrobacterota bacterium]
MKRNIPIINIESAQGARLLAVMKDARRRQDDGAISTVEKTIADVRKNGDKALFAYSKKFDGQSLTPATLRIGDSEISSQAAKAPLDFKTALVEAADRIVAYHSMQKGNSFSIVTKEGRLTQMVRPLSRVGVYVPGGYASYPSSVLMDVIPAQIAGVKEIAVVTPPKSELDPKVAFALRLLKVKEAYRIGGAQAIAALAYGTKSIKAVDKIVGPGNLFVALAKKCVYGTVDIDAVAGPSEVVILADATANPDWVALDLLAQAEHGSGAERALCITENKKLAERIAGCLVDEIQKSPVRAVFEKLHPLSICVCIAKNRDASIKFINDIAPEHLQMITKTCKKDIEKILNASAVFCGPYAPVALGDYFIGTNHVLPTGGAARFGSPLGVESFTKRMSVAEITPAGLSGCAKSVSILARSEKFVHHALSVERRAEILNNI